MPAPDTTIIDLLIDYYDDVDPGGLAAAQAALEADHPQAFADTVVAAVYLASRVKDGTSGTSLTIGTGAQVLTLDESRTWKAGMPVFIVEDGLPGTNFMRGYLTIDEAAQVLTVQVDAVSGSGTFTAWTIFALFHTATVTTPPVTVADGGTGNTTQSGTRADFELIRRFKVLSILSTPPGSPSVDDAHLIGDAPTGAWSANENDIANYNGATWDFTTPAAGDQAYDAGTDDEYIFTGTAIFSGGLWGNSEWKSFFDASRPKLIEITASYTIVEADLRGDLFVKCAPLLAMTVTLPDCSGAGVQGARVTIVYGPNFGGGNITINVSAGGTINGSTSIVLTTLYDSAELIAGDVAVNDWFRTNP